MPGSLPAACLGRATLLWPYLGFPGVPLSARPDELGSLASVTHSCHHHLLTQMTGMQIAGTRKGGGLRLQEALLRARHVGQPFSPFWARLNTHIPMDSIHHAIIISFQSLWTAAMIGNPTLLPRQSNKPGKQSMLAHAENQGNTFGEKWSHALQDETENYIRRERVTTKQD